MIRRVLDWVRPQIPDPAESVLAVTAAAREHAEQRADTAEDLLAATRAELDGARADLRRAQVAFVEERFARREAAADRDALRRQLQAAQNLIADQSAGDATPTDYGKDPAPRRGSVALISDVLDQGRRNYTHVSLLCAAGDCRPGQCRDEGCECGHHTTPATETDLAS